MAYIVQRKDRFYAVAYDGLDPLTGREARTEFGARTRTSRRCVDLDETTVSVLNRWRQRLRRDRLPHGADDWVFCNTKGRFLSPESLSQLFGRLLRRSGLPRIRFHGLRHTPRVAAGGQRRPHQGRHRTSGPRPPRLQPCTPISTCCRG